MAQDLETWLAAHGLASRPLFPIVAWFYRDPIGSSLAAGGWDEAERYPDLLTRSHAGDPVPWATLFADRGRLLAAAGRDDTDTAQGLRRLRDTFLKIGLKTPVREMDAAIRSAG